jgi:hypothetical protein
VTDPSALPRAIVDWENFYVIVGSSGAALIGLQFVVIALVADIRSRSSHDQIGAYATPTIVHFAAALVMSSIMSAPWRSLSGVAVAVALGGLAGAAYVLTALGRALRQKGYRPVWEDWLWFTILPFAAYATLFLAALQLPSRPQRAPFAIAAAALALLLIGIHNAWDAVIFIVVEHIGNTSQASNTTGSSEPGS